MEGAMKDRHCHLDVRKHLPEALWPKVIATAFDQLHAFMILQLTLCLSLSDLALLQTRSEGYDRQSLVEQIIPAPRLGAADIPPPSASPARTNRQRHHGRRYRMRLEYPERSLGNSS
jgi:hypothetical protein